jgi:hypothetical protein
LEIGRANIILITLNSGEVRLYFLEIDLKKPNKNLLKLCCFAYFTFVIPEVSFLQVQDQVYLLLVDRDPTTTTHRF